MVSHNPGMEACHPREAKRKFCRLSAWVLFTRSSKGKIACVLQAFRGVGSGGKHWVTGTVAQKPGYSSQHPAPLGPSSSGGLDQPLFSRRVSLHIENLADSDGTVW